MRCEDCGSVIDEHSTKCDKCRTAFDMEPTKDVHIDIEDIEVEENPKLEFKRTHRWIFKALISSIVIVSLILLYALYNLLVNSAGQTIMAEYRDLKSNSPLVIFYFGKDQEKRELIEKYADNYDFDFLQANSSRISRRHRQEIIRDLNLLNLNEVIAIVSNGEVVASTTIREKEEITKFLYDKGVIPLVFADTGPILEKFRVAMDSEMSIIYLITSDNEKTKKHREFLFQLGNSYSFDYAEISGYLLSNRQLHRIMLQLGFSEIQENMLLIIRDGSVARIIHEGDVDTEDYFDIFISYGIIDNESERFLTAITLSDFEQIIGRGDLSAIVIGRENCPVCNVLTPMVGQIAMLNSITIYYLDATNSIERVTEITGNAGNQVVSFPSIIIVERERVIDYMIGFVDRAFLIERLKENGIIR